MKLSKETYSTLKRIFSSRSGPRTNKGVYWIDEPQVNLSDSWLKGENYGCDKESEEQV